MIQLTKIINYYLKNILTREKFLLNKNENSNIIHHLNFFHLLDQFNEFKENKKLSNDIK
jgi:hypothetical protein